MAKDKRIIRSACRMCHGGCGVLVHFENGKIVKIKGDPASPLNRGNMCPKGLASMEQLYHPDRLKYPMRRAGKRGEGKWERISWDEALMTIASRVDEIRKSYGPESISLGQGTGRYYYLHMIRFANALGTPNWCEPGMAQCFFPRLLTGVMTYGDLPICDYYGDVNPACILVWGHNPLISGPDGEIQFRVKGSINAGTKLIVVDPRKTEMAKKAEIWLQIRPGTDDALALGMMNVIIGEGIYDKQFVDNWTVGFDRLSERIGEYPPERVEKITWVPAGQIRAAARLFAQAKPAAVEWGCALEHTPKCLQTVRAVGLLPALTGNIDVPGGWILGMHSVSDPDLLMGVLSEEIKNKRMGADHFKVLCSSHSFLPSAHAPTLFNAMITGKPYPIKAFLIFGNNALATYANSKQVYEALMKVGFLTVMDIFMTPTAELADIVLPGATWLEADEVAVMPLIVNNVALAQQKIVRLWESKQVEEVYIELANRLNLEVGRESLEEIFNKQLEPMGITFEDLKEKGFEAPPIKYGKYKETGFKTGSGKVELASGYLEMLGYDPVPYYEEPPESPISTPELARDFPLILITGGRSQYYFNSEYRQISSLRAMQNDPLVEIHPATASEYGIKDGDWVWIESPRGRIQQRARVTDEIDPRVVNVQQAWWFPEDPGPEHGIWKSNANMLTSNAPPYDPAIGTYQLRALLCTICKVEVFV